jgi:hypothetical protein
VRREKLTDDARDPAKYRQADVDREVRRAATLEEDREGRQKDGEDVE